MNPIPQERPFTAEDQPAQDGLLVGAIDNKPVLLDFEAGRLSSDAGLLLIGQVDQQLGLTHALASVLPDKRDPNRTRHSMEDLLRQRVFQIAAGYEDQDDSDTLRIDPRRCTSPLQAALGPVAGDRRRPGFAAEHVAF